MSVTVSREAALQARIDDLEFEVAELRAALAPEDWHAPKAWRLSPGETDVVRILMTQGRVTPSMFAAANQLRKGCYENRGATLGVHICSIRRKAGPFGLCIETLYGIGYALSRAQRAALQRGEHRLGPPRSPPLRYHRTPARVGDAP